MIEKILCDKLCLGITPFRCDIPQCVGIEGVCVTKSIMNIVGWVELELGVPGIGYMTTRLWVAATMFNKAIPVVLGSHQIKKFFAQAEVDKFDCWPQPWKIIYDLGAHNQWYSDRCSETLSDSNGSNSETSFEIINPPLDYPRHMDAMLEQLELPQMSWEEEVQRVEKGIERCKGTALKGIPGPQEERDDQD